MRYRQTGTKPRSGWAEWGPFLLALILGAGLLFALALTGPIFSGPDPLPDSNPSTGHAKAPSQQPSPDPPQ